jgi:hypothetical protein
VKYWLVKISYVEWVVSSEADIIAALKRSWGREMSDEEEAVAIQMMLKADRIRPLEQALAKVSSAGEEGR